MLRTKFPYEDMKIVVHAGVVKPCWFILTPKFSVLTTQFSTVNQFMQIPFHNGSRFLSHLKCSLTDRMYSSTDKSTLRKSNFADLSRPQKRPSSLYARPSLLQMKNDKIANRATVYEFLKGLGIIPDELDGLELPVSLEVMKERIDFLHKLGLSIEDINNYPLVLGCSVKKNMIPVLDYLGKIGVRKSMLTDLLQRYPQVLHSSVVVDLQPVVKYLQGMDIRPNDVPRVIERYPDLLGFKLEGTMSTSVAYLVGIGVSRREIGGVLTRYPEILGMRVGRVIKPFVEYLELLGLPELAVARLIEKRPHILGFSLEAQVKPNIGALVDFNVKQEMLAALIAQYPEIIGLDLKSKLLLQHEFFHSTLNIDKETFGAVIEKMPQVVSLKHSSVLRHLEFLNNCGFSVEQVERMVVDCPQLLALNLDIMKLSFDYLMEEMGRDLDDMVKFPAFFTYGLESTVRPRHEVVSKKGLKCSLAWLLNCSDEKFEERMDYDTIDMEEMEMVSSFDMNTLTRPRDEDSDEEDEESDYDDYSDNEYPQLKR